MVWANQIIVLFDTTHLELQYPIHFSNSYSSKFARAHSSFCTWHIFFCHHPQHPHSNNNANSQNWKKVERFMMNWCYDSLVCGNNANASFKPSHISLFAIITFYHCYNYLTLTNIWWCRGGRMLLMLLSSNTNLFCILCCSAVPYFPFHCGAIYKLLFASFVAAPMCSSWFISSLSFPHLCCNGFFLSFNEFHTKWRRNKAENSIWLNRLHWSFSCCHILLKSPSSSFSVANVNIRDR